MQDSHKNIEISVGMCSKVADIGVCFSIPFKCSPCCLKKLLCLIPPKEEHLMRGSEEAALAFALFETIRSKMVGSPLESSKSKVSNITCKSLNGNFLIYWNCQGTGSSLKKNMGLALSALQPHKLYSKYKENMKFLKASAPREHFNYCVKNMNAAIKSKIHVAAIGRIKTNRDKLNIILKAVSKKLPQLSDPSASEIQKIPQRENAGEMYPHVKCDSGLGCLVVADYISSNSGNMGVEVHTGIVEIYNRSWESKKKQLKNSKRIDDYVRKKYSKSTLKDHISLLLGYFAITHTYTDCNTLKKLIKHNLSPKEISDLIKKNLK